MSDARAYSVASDISPPALTMIKRREPTQNDVQIKILFCGICHSDFCGHPIQKVNEIYDRSLKSDVMYRFSIDMASLNEE